jgi:hypothetical protein
MPSAFLVASLLVATTAFCAARAEMESRPLPRTSPGNPGNIFRVGEEVTVSLPPSESAWHLTDYDGRSRGEVKAADGRAALGRLEAGWFRLAQPGRDWVSLAVLPPLAAPTPRTSPVALDVAMAWFYPEAKMADVARLCALAGVNRVRDRLTWADMEPRRGEFSGLNKYDASLRAQSRAGLEVLQVIHHSPAWAAPDGKRFPPDLRDAYRFYEAMARRWRGQLAAFEPWNEADIAVFGGHTGAEMAALQKAAYLGLKAGHPEITACLNVFAHHGTHHLADLHANEAWPYFDTYNLHHYEPFDRYPQIYAHHRAVSAGRPLWVTECAVPVKWAGDESHKEPSDPDLRVQADRVAKTFAASLHQGAAATFYFLLPHYVEGPTQFGILRPDLTPRPAFAALAAVGRWLADATPLGRWTSGDPETEGYLFAARPDGMEREVLVVWRRAGEGSLRWPVPPQQRIDAIGRPMDPASAPALTASPVFAVFPKGAASQFPLTPPPAAPPRLPGQPSPVVLQPPGMADATDLALSARKLPPGPARLSLFAYNFAPHPVNGSLTPPAGWSLETPQSIELAPMDRREIILTGHFSPAADPPVTTLTLRGHFGTAGQPTASFRLTPQSSP